MFKIVKISVYIYLYISFFEKIRKYIDIHKYINLKILTLSYFYYKLSLLYYVSNFPNFFHMYISWIY